MEALFAPPTAVFATLAARFAGACFEIAKPTSLSTSPCYHLSPHLLRTSCDERPTVSPITGACFGSSDWGLWQPVSSHTSSSAFQAPSRSACVYDASPPLVPMAGLRCLPTRLDIRDPIHCSAPTPSQLRCVSSLRLYFPSPPCARLLRAREDSFILPIAT